MNETESVALEALHCSSIVATICSTDRPQHSVDQSCDTTTEHKRIIRYNSCKATHKAVCSPASASGRQSFRGAVSLACHWLLLNHHEPMS